MKPKVLLLFSGGFDSTVLLHDLLKQGKDVHLLFVNYGQKPLREEMNFFTYWVDKYNLNYTTLEIPPIKWSNSTMFQHGNHNKAIDDDYIEMRNPIFLSYASSLAESLGIPTIASALLWNSFKDTTPYFAKSFDAMLFNTGEMDLYSPYMYFKKKTEFGEYAIELLGEHVVNEILEHTISCNVPVDGKVCGECHECKSIAEIKEKIIHNPLL